SSSSSSSSSSVCTQGFTVPRGVRLRRRRHLCVRRDTFVPKGQETLCHVLLALTSRSKAPPAASPAPKVQQQQQQQQHNTQQQQKQQQQQRVRAGFYCPAGSSSPAEETLVCPKGHFCPEGTGDPLPCAAGTYQPQQGATSCLPCPEGAAAAAAAAAPAAAAA